MQQKDLEHVVTLRGFYEYSNATCGNERKWLFAQFMKATVKLFVMLGFYDMLNEYKYNKGRI